MKLVKDLAIFEDWAREQHDPMLSGYQKCLVPALFFLHPSICLSGLSGGCKGTQGLCVFDSLPSADLPPITRSMVTVCRVKETECSPRGWHAREAVGLRGETALCRVYRLFVQLVHGAALDCLAISSTEVGTLSKGSWGTAFLPIH